MDSALQRRAAEYPWRLRAAWATGEPVLVRYEIGRDEVRQAEGWVAHVASTGGFALLRLTGDAERDEPLHVPISAMIGVSRLDHFHQGRGRPPRRPAPDQGVFLGQLGLVEAPAVSPRAMRVALAAAAEMLPPDVLGVIAALDRAGKRPTIERVAAEAGRSPRWTAKRLRELEVRGYVRRFRRRGKPDLLVLS